MLYNFKPCSILSFGWVSDHCEPVKCQRLFRPQFSKVKTSFFFEIRQVLDTLMPNVDVSDDTLV